MDQVVKRWRHWHLKNTFLLMAGMLVFYELAKTPAVDTFIKQLGSLGYIGAFMAGFFFVSTYTALPAGYVLFELAKYLNAWEVAIIAGLGCMTGDYVIFRFVKDRVVDELKPYFTRLNTRKIRHIIHTPYFAWLLPVMGAAIIASPFPDEVGIAMMGAAAMSNITFLALSYALNTAGILLIVILAQAAR